MNVRHRQGKNRERRGLTEASGRGLDDLLGIGSMEGLSNESRPVIDEKTVVDFIFDTEKLAWQRNVN